MPEDHPRAAVRPLPRTPVRYQPSPWPGHCARLGLIALATDHASERELRRLLAAADADLFVTRVRHGGTCNLAYLRAMEDELAGATSLLLPGTPLDAIAFGCTSGTVAIGMDRVRAAIHSVRPGVPVTTPITAALRAFTGLGAQRLALLTPYVDEVNRMVVDYLEDEGVTIDAFATFELDTDFEMTSVPPEAIEAAVAGLDTARVDAVFICCTALRALPIVARLERQLRAPVVTSNQAMAWEMLRQAGYTRPLDGFGRLLVL